jgi:1,4-dihydroxy-2-naphthoyl-CoA synthase
MKSVTKSAVSEKMAEEGQLFMSMIPQAPAQEAFKAFGEKRAPNFKQFEN